MIKIHKLQKKKSLMTLTPGNGVDQGGVLVKVFCVCGHPPHHVVTVVAELGPMLYNFLKP
jgi:hypothetical protein